MRKMFVICFKELKNFKLIFTSVYIYYTGQTKRIALYHDNDLIATIDLSKTKLKHKDTFKDNKNIIVRFYLEDRW